MVIRQECCLSTSTASENPPIAMNFKPTSASEGDHGTNSYCGRGRSTMGPGYPSTGLHSLWAYNSHSEYVFPQAWIPLWIPLQESQVFHQQHQGFNL